MSNELDFRRLYFDGEGDNGDPDSGTTPAPSGNGGDDGKGGGEGGGDEKKYSDAELDAIINKKFAKWQKQHEHDVDEATKLANMTAQERAEHERDELQKELAELKAANERAEMEKTARGILQKDGVNVSDTIVSALIGDDAESTSANVKDFIKAYKADVQEGVKASLAHKTPSTGEGGTSKPSKADIRKETNTHARLEMYRESMGLKQ